jgi:hypothetical protein
MAKARGALGTVAVVPLADSPDVIAQPEIKWRMSTAWTRRWTSFKARPRLARVVEETSGRRFHTEALT